MSNAHDRYPVYHKYVDLMQAGAVRENEIFALDYEDVQTFWDQYAAHYAEHYEWTCLRCSQRRDEDRRNTR